jgi:hypothetical protein
MDEQPRMQLLPPAAHLCQECATGHLAAEPHNAQSLFYQMRFKMETGNDPSWLTAMAHCAPEVQAAWKAGLEGMGIDVDAGQINPPAQRKKGRS